MALTPEEKQTAVNRFSFWWHSIDLGHGVITPGKRKSEHLSWQADRALHDVVGKSVLDVGAWNGYFCFQAEQRGAARILATDHFVWTGDVWGQEGRRQFDAFLTARDILRSGVEYKIVDATEICPDTVGTFDVVLFLGVLYHLRDPFSILERVASCARERIVVETETALDYVPFPVARYFPNDELSGDPTNWWAPNIAAVRESLKTFGFPRIIEFPDPHFVQLPARGRVMFIGCRE